MALFILQLILWHKLSSHKTFTFN